MTPGSGLPRISVIPRKRDYTDRKHRQSELSVARGGQLLEIKKSGQPYMSKSIEVRDYMRKPITVDQDLTVSEASQVILKNKLSGVVVIDNDHHLVGMLSELDCLKAMVSAVYNGNAPGTEKVKHVMTTKVEVNHPQEDIITVAATMLDHKHRRRPVTENGKLVGQITCRQLLRAISEFGDD